MSVHDFTRKYRKGDPGVRARDLNAWRSVGLGYETAFSPGAGCDAHVVGMRRLVELHIMRMYFVEVVGPTEESGELLPVTWVVPGKTVPVTVPESARLKLKASVQTSNSTATWEMLTPSLQEGDRFFIVAVGANFIVIPPFDFDP